MSKKETRLMKYLSEVGSITSMDAIKELGDTRLAATVFELRRKGVNIISTSETSVNRWGEKECEWEWKYLNTPELKKIIGE